MELIIDLQNETHVETLPQLSEFQEWVKASLIHVNFTDPTELTIRIVDPEEIQDLNKRFRKQDKVTNVLAFPFTVPNGVTMERRLLGDIVICAPIVMLEANEQVKNINEHWAHLIVHATLHLLGYDHIHDKDANVMENQEIKILKSMGIANPYTETID